MNTPASPSLPAGIDAARPRASIIVPCYKSLGTVKELLTSLARQVGAPPFEIILIDNGPTDGLPALVAHHAAALNIKLVMALDGQGTAFARNVGVRAASGGDLLFVDHDDTVDERYVKAMTDALVEHEFVCSRVDFKVLNSGVAATMDNQFQTSGVSQLAGASAVLHGSGGTLGIRRETCEKIGPFAEDVPFCDDTDFCIRAHLGGVVLQFVPEAILHYRLRAGARATFRQRMNWGRAEALVFRKYASVLDWHPPVRSQLRQWRAIIRRLPRIRHAHGRLWLATYAGICVGRLIGSLENFVFFI